MADEQYDKFAKMLHHLEESTRIAEELFETTGEHLIGAEDWDDQIKMLNEAIAQGHSDLTTRANTLIQKLQRFKPTS
jgi:hypothetical protein